MRQGYFIGLLLLGTWFLAPAQEIAEGVYWISFTDKKDNGYSYSQPEQFLSQRSIDRRAWQGLGVDESDEPVTQSYVNTLRTLSYEVRHVSRWLNGAVLVNTPHHRFLEVLDLDFVDTLRWEPETDGIYFPAKPSGQRFDPPLASPPDFNYGESRGQLRQLNLVALHQAGYTGSGVWIGILDAGFSNVDNLPAFQPMISEGRLLGTRNFVNDTSVFKLVNTHGMKVLSIAGGLDEGVITGAAPKASFYLVSTENTWEETRLEEIAWIAGAEFLDSLGVDIFNTSLGYSVFNGEGIYDYSYQDMDGQSTYISRAASMLASKGILASTSAGNEGRKSWYRLTAPADAFHTLSVAAVDSLGNLASFSSRGPTADGRLQPNVAAQGSLTAYQHETGTWARGYGTSFSSPLVAGGSACLWQAFPEVSAANMVQKVKESGNQANLPESGMGYGIPNFLSAYWPTLISGFPLENKSLKIYPNPASEHLQVEALEPGDPSRSYRVRIFDVSGRSIHSEEVTLPARLLLGGKLEAGMYILEVRGEELWRLPFVKK